MDRPDIAGIDMGEAMSRLAGNYGLLSRVAIELVNIFDQQRLTLVSELKQREFEKAYQVAHSIKGIAANIVATCVLKATKEIERGCLNHSEEEALLGFTELEQAIEEMRTSLPAVGH